MGRTVYAEECLLSYLTSLMKPDGYTIGLILGQSTAQKDFVVHLARTPPPAAKDVVEETLISSTQSTQEDLSSLKYIKSVKDIHESWVADHAKHVTRMLPGGMCVLGVFVVGPEDALNDNNSTQKLRSVLLAIQKNLCSNKYLYGCNKEESLLLSFNSVTQKYNCKSVDVSKGGILKPADWKFVGKATKWHQLETLVDFNRLFPFPMGKDPDSLKNLLQNILKNVADSIESSLVIIEGEARSLDDTLEMITKKKKDRKDCQSGDGNASDKILQAGLYIPSPKNVNTEIKVTSCSASMQLVGQVFCWTFVHQKATIEEATVAIKQDIVRSLASRLEMHWDSLIEEENGSPEESVTLHEPPRRVLVALPQNKVTLSDYLFPGEGAQEALVSLRELLDLEVQESSVQKDLELQVDPSEFYCQNDIIDKVSADGEKDSTEKTQLTLYITGISIAFLVLIAAVIVHQIY